MADPHRMSALADLGAADPGGALAAFAAPAAGMAAIRGRLADARFAAAAEAALDFALPAAPDRALIEGRRTAFRLGPDNWLVVDEADADFGRKLEDAAGLIARDMTSARARLRIRGAAVRDLLAVGAQIDLRLQAFPAGAFAQTTVANASVILHARDIDLFDAYVARSYAVSWRRWLAMAGVEFDLTLAETSR